MVNYYIATSLQDNREEYIGLQAYVAFSMAPFQLMYDRTASDSSYTESIDVRSRTAWTRVAAVRRTDILVVIFPGGIETHIELGIALALRIPTVLYVPDDEDLKSIFYSHPSIRKVVKQSQGFRALLEAMWQVSTYPCFR